MPRGGYQEPSQAKRAAVSNPRSGKRTDGGMGSKQRQKMMEVPSNGQYGYRKETAGLQSPMGLAGSSTPPQPQAQRSAPAPVTPIFAPTAYEGRPVTHGATVGPGMTPEPQMNDRFAMMNAYKDAFDTLAAQPGVPEGFKVFWQAAQALARNAK